MNDYIKYLLYNRLQFIRYLRKEKHLGILLINYEKVYHNSKSIIHKDMVRLIKNEINRR